MVENRYSVHATHPQAILRTKDRNAAVSYFDDPYDALKGVDAELVCSEWSVLWRLDWEKAGHLMGRRLVIDDRNLYNARKMQELGFDYYSFGRS